MSIEESKQRRPLDDMQMLVERGDVAGLPQWMRSKPIETLPPDIMGQVSKAVRKLGNDDLSEMVEVAFAEIIAFSTILLLRCQAHVVQRLSECDEQSGDRTHMPTDLDRDQWLSRIERISRFIAEMAAIRGRVQHVGQLTRKAATPTPTNGSVNQYNSPFDPDRHPATSQPAPPANGRQQISNGRLHFS